MFSDLHNDLKHGTMAIINHKPRQTIINYKSQTWKMSHFPLLRVVYGEVLMLYRHHHDFEDKACCFSLFLLDFASECFRGFLLLNSQFLLTWFLLILVVPTRHVNFSWDPMMTSGKTRNFTDCQVSFGSYQVYQIYQVTSSPLKVSLGMIVTRLAWMAHKLVSSKRPTRYASAASCRANTAWLAGENPGKTHRTVNAYPEGWG